MSTVSYLALAPRKMVKAPDGTVIKSFEWCSRLLQVKGIETMPIADIQAPDSPADCIPSLASLAYQKHFNSLQAKAMQLDETVNQNLHDLQTKGESELRAVHLWRSLLSQLFVPSRALGLKEKFILLVMIVKLRSTLLYESSFCSRSSSSGMNMIIRC